MNNLIKMTVVCGLTLLLTGCGEGFYKPFKKPMIEEIKPNETAFLVPLKGSNQTSQKEFMSQAYLEENKVATKRIELPQEWRQMGRAMIFSEGQWVPIARVIKVDRTPISRKWDDVQRKRGANNDDGFIVESSDSIGFIIGAIMQAKITEKDATLFLYSYSTKGLKIIVDEDIRSFIGNVLTRECGMRDIERCKLEKAEMFAIVAKEAKSHFSKFGITITHLGQSGQMNYMNPAIQKAIDEKAKADAAVKVAKKEQEKRIIEAETEKRQKLIDMEKQTAIAAEQQKREKIQFETKKQNALIQEQQKLEVAAKQAAIQDVINEKNKRQSDAERYVKEQAQKVIATTVQLKELDIRMIEANAKLELGKNYKGGVPTTIFGGQGGGMNNIIPFLNVTDIIKPTTPMKK